MVFNRKDLTKAFSPTKLKKVTKRRSGSNGNSKPSTSGSTAKMRSNPVSETNIKVIVRLRPSNEREDQENFRTIIKVIDERMLVFDPKEEENPFFYRGVAQKGRDLLKKQNKELQFVFDRVFDSYSSNTDVFEGSTKELINGLLDGYNCSVFAYGATGAGKTHTMIGKEGDPGITYRTMAELFSQIESQKETRDFNLGVTYLEIYNENVQDLLHKVGPLHLREDGRSGVIVAGLKIVPIYNADELLSLLAKGNKNRTQHATDANQESSRSHAVFQVYININNKLDGQVKHVKLSMIDLAGSERASATGCRGQRFKEGANINKSLLALGNCINNLADGIRHIPYRDSKLTRLLKDSLGGNCQTVMIANIGPSSATFEDTYNTLRYANRAKKIKTTVKKNIVSCEIHISGYVKMVEEQKKEIEMLKQKLLLIQNDKQSISEPAAFKVSEENIKISNKLEELYERKRLLNEKVLSLESQDKIMYCRILFKKAADRRLKNLTSAIDLINTEEQNASGKSRVNKSLQYFMRQREGIRIQMKAAWEELCQVEENIKEVNKEIASKNIEKSIADKLNLFNCKVDKTRSQQQFENAKKIISLQQCENESMYRMVGMMSTTLQKFYNTMRGSGTITEKLKLEFKELVKSLEGIRNIKWSDSNTTKEEEDFYTMTNLSVQNLENPCSSNIPYLLDISSDLQEPKNNDCNQSNEITSLNITPSKDICPAIKEGILNSTITINSNSEPMDEDLTIETADESNKLNCTFNIQETKANKRKLVHSDSKSQFCSKPTPAKTKKISPKQVKPPVSTLLNGKENSKEPQQKPVLSENSIKILNKLKAEKLKPAMVSTEEQSDSNLKFNKIKERRGMITSNTLNQKNNLPNKKTLPAWQF